MGEGSNSECESLVRSLIKGYGGMERVMDLLHPYCIAR